MFFGKGKRKIIADYKSEDIYKFYKNKYKEKAVDYKTFNKIWNRFIDIRMQMLIYENMEFYFPFGLGSLRIRLGQQAIKIDKEGKLKYTVHWGNTIEKWKELYPNKTAKEIKAISNKPLCYTLNKNTDGRRISWFWDKMTSTYKNKSAYRIELTRKWNRMLAQKVINTKKIEYYE